MKRSPVPDSASIRRTRSSTGTGASFCSPSRGPTSRTSTRAGREDMPTTLRGGARQVVRWCHTPSLRYEHMFASVDAARSSLNSVAAGFDAAALTPDAPYGWSTSWVRSVERSTACWARLPSGSPRRVPTTDVPRWAACSGSGPVRCVPRSGPRRSSRSCRRPTRRCGHGLVFERSDADRGRGDHQPGRGSIFVGCRPARLGAVARRVCCGARCGRRSQAAATTSAS